MLPPAAMLSHTTWLCRESVETGRQAGRGEGYRKAERRGREERKRERERERDLHIYI